MGVSGGVNASVLSLGISSHSTSPGEMGFSFLFGKLLVEIKYLRNHESADQVEERTDSGIYLEKRNSDPTWKEERI